MNVPVNGCDIKGHVDRLRHDAFAVNNDNRDAIERMQESIRRLTELDREALAECMRRLDAWPDTVMAISVAYRDHDVDAGDGRIEDLEERTEAFQDRELTTWIDESLSAMARFLEGCGSAIPTFLSIVRHRIEPGQVAGRLRLGFIRGPDFVFWQSRDFVAPALLPLVMRWTFEFDTLLCSSATIEQPFVPGPLFQFHPERFRRTRRYTKGATRYCIGGCLPELDDIQSMMNLIINEMNDRRHEVDRRETVALKLHTTIVVEAEEQLAFGWAKYVGAGRQIFDVPLAMLEMLRHTDIDDVPVDLLRLPYPVLYLHLGPQGDLELEPGWPIDGAYIEHHAQHQLLTFTFTAMPRNACDANRWHAFGEPVASISLPPAVAGYDLGAAIDHQLTERMNQLRTEQGDRDASSEMAALLAEAGGSSSSRQVQITTSTRATAHLAQEERRTPVLRSAMRLAVNALCYLTAYPEDIEAVWPDGTPDRLRRLLTNGTPKEQTRARSKLEALGYTAVNLCGRRLTDVVVPAATLASSLRPHWRRGHWRRQAHGEGKMLRKIVWIMPTMVHAGQRPSDAESALGHIYRTGAL